MKLSIPLSLSVCFALGLANSVPAGSLSATTSATSSSASILPPMFPLSSDSEFSFLLLENMAIADGQGANAGEVLTAAQQIQPGNFESFYQAFFDLANNIKAVTDKLNPKLYPVSVREASFHIATYYRAADFFLHGNPSDPRIDSLWNLQTEYFNTAISLMSPPGKRVLLDSGAGFQIPVIFYSPDADCTTPRPTLLYGNGYDGSQEESLHIVGNEVLARGWNFVTYEGPGQPTVRRDQNLGFRPDWWKVVTPVVDYLASLPEVNMSKLGLAGISFGGTLAPRAAAYEHRFAAVICIDGLYSLQQALEADFPPELVELFNSGNKKEFDEVMHAIQVNTSMPTSLRWIIDQGEWAFDTTSAWDWFSRLGDYTLAGITDKVKVPVFIGSGQGDLQTLGQGLKAAEAFGDLATYYQFNNSLGAGQHCQLGAESYVAQVSLDWFQDTVVDKKD